ncbi:hypothetical protein [Frankia sp. R82]|uniref:hypothetical protein n=1 Tax=Frankia sp. R82 TaxID=2950553 RepID=UPI0020437F9F|nr:hypothetical protein [Frankia sp. R82]MCM3882133.1 hypothetical protein [Frankia sp. R82]
MAVLPGDGIGPEAIKHALATLQAPDLGLDFDVFDQVSAQRYLRIGGAMTDVEIGRIRRAGGGQRQGAGNLHSRPRRYVQYSRGR